MLKVAGRVSRFVLVWTVVSLVVLDSAWAGRRRWHHAAHCTQGMCYESCELSCSGMPVECGCSAVLETSPVEAGTVSPSDAPTAPPIPDEDDSPAPSAASPPAPVTQPQVEANVAAPPTPPAARATPAITPTTPAKSLIEEDDPFAPAPMPTAPAANAPSTRPAAPATRPVAPPAAAPDDNDPFAPPPPARPAAAVPPRPAVNPAADPAADPFKISALQESSVRQWTDDTGLFSVRGRLIAILDDKVRILKETGRTTTVPMTRLSRADQKYVEGFKALTIGQGERLVGSDLSTAIRQ